MNVRVITPDSDETECLHCTRDKHSPKVYNNMNPGCVPPELMVGSCKWCVYMYLHPSKLAVLLISTRQLVYQSVLEILFL